MMPWIINTIILILIIFLLRRFSQKSLLKGYFWPGLILKLACGIGVGLLYKFYYKQEGDTFYLFNLSAYLAELFRTQPNHFWSIIAFNQFDTESKTFFFIWNQPRALIFVKIVSFINIISFSNYWITSIYLSLISFVGSWKIANFISSKFSIEKEVSAFAFLFFPSVVFWSSGILKESLMMAAIGLLIPASFYLLIEKKNLVLNGLIVILTVLLLWYLKYYYAALLLATLMAFLTGIIFREKFAAGLGIQLLVFFFVLLVGFAITTIFHPNLFFTRFPQALYKNYYNTIHANTVPDYLYPGFEATWKSIILNFPDALVSGLFRPFIWNAEANFQLFAGIENLFVLMMLLTAIIYYFTKPDKCIKLSAVAVITYVVIIAGLLALASPNFGSLIRYKTGFLPFFIILITHQNPVFYFFSGSKIPGQRGNSPS